MTRRVAAGAHRDRDPRLVGGAPEREADVLGCEPWSE